MLCCGDSATVTLHDELNNLRVFTSFRVLLPCTENISTMALDSCNLNLSYDLDTVDNIFLTIMFSHPTGGVLLSHIPLFYVIHPVLSWCFSTWCN